MLVVYAAGIYSYKNENIRSYLSSVFHSAHDVFYSDCKPTLDSIPHTFQLIIPDSSKAIIQECRDNAIAANILRDEFKIKVPASLIYRGDTLRVKIRLKGDYSDHWKGSKWSYRVYVLDDKYVFGMKKFSIQSPETRGMLAEWYFHSLLKAEGLVALRNKYVSLKENGEDKGIYLVEESFDKYLIENNERRESPILKFDESIWIDNSKVNSNGSYSQEDIFIMAKVDMFKSKSILKDSLLNSHYNNARVLLADLKSGNSKLAKVVDIDKAAQLFAIADLTGGHHALRWKNVRFYYNPLIGKLELIAFDSNSGKVIKDIYYNTWAMNKLDQYDVRFWKSLFFRDSEFVDFYFKHLKRLADPSFLESFHLNISAELNTNASCVCLDYPFHYFSTDNYILNAQIIQSKLAKYDANQSANPNKYFISAAANNRLNLADEKINVSLTNNSNRDVYIIGVFNGYNNIISDKYRGELNRRGGGRVAESKNFTFDLIAPIDTIQTNLSRKSNKWVYKAIKIGYLYSNSVDTLYTRIEVFHENKFITTDEYNLPSAIFDINHETKKVKISSGNWVFDKDIVTPRGYDVSCGINTHMTFNNSSTFVLNGNISFQGATNNHIIIDSEDSTGSFFVSQATGRSFLNNVTFNNLSGTGQSKWHLSGSVNFYESDVEMDNVKIYGNNSEDALNFVRSEFKIANCLFENIYSDAVDADFCNGTILNCTFKTVGNDALDFSGSSISLNKISIQYVGDKGISAGEKSIVTGSDIKIDSVEIGIVSKDQSTVTLDKVEINQSLVAYVVFQKKTEYGPAQIDFTNFVSSKNQEPYLLELNSKATINSQEVTPNSENVKSILYGNLYGKKSG